MPGLPPAIFNCKKSICIMLFVKISIFSLRKKKKKKKQIIEKDLLLDQMHQMSVILKEVVRNSDAELSTVKAQFDEKDSSLFELRKLKARVTLDYERTDDELRRSRRELSSIAHEMLLQSEQITDFKKELALRKRSERELTDQARDAEAENKKLVSELIEITSKFETTERELVSVKSLREDLSIQLCNVKQENATLGEQVKLLAVQHREVCKEKVVLMDKLEMAEHENHHHRYELKTIKSRHRWVSGRLTRLSELIKERMQSYEVFCFKCPLIKKKIVQDRNSLAHLDDESYRLAEELLHEFPSPSTLSQQLQ